MRRVEKEGLDNRRPLASTSFSTSSISQSKFGFVARVRSRCRPSNPYRRRNVMTFRLNAANLFSDSSIGSNLCDTRSHPPIARRTTSVGLAALTCATQSNLRRTVWISRFNTIQHDCHSSYFVQGSICLILVRMHFF